LAETFTCFSQRGKVFVERATRKSVHIDNDYVDILQSVYIINEEMSWNKSWESTNVC
jgi:hypothetical protein